MLGTRRDDPISSVFRRYTRLATGVDFQWGIRGLVTHSQRMIAITGAEVYTEEVVHPGCNHRRPFAAYVTQIIH